MKVMSVVALCVVLGVGATAGAAPPADKEVARAAANEARQHYNLGEFEPALEAYKKAYRLTDDPVLLFNIGQCQWKLGDDKAALHSYRSYLRSQPDSPNRDLVESRIADLERRMKSTPAPMAEPVPADDAKPVAPSESMDLRPSTAQVAPSTNVVEPVQNPAPENKEARPLYMSGWLWGGVAVAVLGAVAGFLILRSGGSQDPACPKGATCGSGI